MRAVTVHDTKEAKIEDLSAQFYLTPEDVGRNRAEASKDKLQELNTSVAVSASTHALDDAFLKQFQVMIRVLRVGDRRKRAGSVRRPSVVLWRAAGGAGACGCGGRRGGDAKGVTLRTVSACAASRWWC